MFDFFRKSEHSDNLLLSSSSNVSKTSIRASAIFPESNKGGADNANSLQQDIHVISSEESEYVAQHSKKDPSGNNNDNNNKTHFLFSSSTPFQNSRQSTNLLPRNQGIAYQRSMVDELKHHHETKALEGVIQQLQSMSLREQERAMLDMYPVTSQAIDELESSKTQEQWMEQMDTAIAAKATPHHPALQLAMHTNLQYVKEQRWKFLRAEFWNVERGVDRLARFLELKLEAFGSGCLCQELRLDDLAPHEIDLWRETGFLQVLDERDQSGRPVVFLFGKAQMRVPIETVIRVSIYLSCLSANENDIQKSGTVQGYWGHGQPFLADRKRATAFLKAWRCLPLRHTATHFCYDNTQLRPVFSLMAQHWNPLQNIRFRAHYGTPLECLYNLTTYGISRDSVPVRDDGTMFLDYHRSFMEALEVREKAERLLAALGEGQGDLDEPFLALMDQEDLFQQMSMEGFSFDDLDPLPIYASIEDILPEDVVARLTRSIDSSGEPLPIDTSLSDWQSMPKSFLSMLARASFIRSGPTSATDKINRTPEVVKSAASNGKPPQKGAVGITKYILVPGPLDVIMGRGRHNKNKPGNCKLQQKLEEHYEQYEMADKYQKTALAEHILNVMKGEGSRFLVRQGEKKHGLWVQVSEEKARDKIAHDFRNMRRACANKAESEEVNREKRPRSTTSSTDSMLQAFKRPFGF